MSDRQLARENPKHRPPPFWNVISVLVSGGCFFCIWPFPLVFIALRGTTEYTGAVAEYGPYVVLGIFITCGFLCGIVALARSERFKGLSVLGLMLNGLVVLFLIHWFGMDSLLPESPVPPKADPSQGRSSN